MESGAIKLCCDSHNPPDELSTLKKADSIFLAAMWTKYSAPGNDIWARWMRNSGLTVRLNGTNLIDGSPGTYIEETRNVFFLHYLQWKYMSEGIVVAIGKFREVLRGQGKSFLDIDCFELSTKRMIFHFSEC